MRVGGVLETCLYTDTLEPTARFYQEVLGLEPLSREPERHAFFRCGQGVLLLFDPAHSEVAGRDVPSHGARGPGHVAFSVPQEELDPWRDRLGSLGVEVESEVRWPRGGRSLYLRDPAGNSVELTSPSIWGLAEQGPE